MILHLLWFMGYSIKCLTYEAYLKQIVFVLSLLISFRIGDDDLSMM
jgi:hypothetical protein